MGQILNKASASDVQTGTNNSRVVTPYSILQGLKVYVPDQTSFAGSYAFGPGLRSLAHESGEDGYDNIAIGQDAGLALTTGRANVLIGTNCGRYMTRSDVGNGYDGGGLGNSGNTFVGRSVGAAALGCLDNSMYGINCGQNLTDGMDNVGSGANVLRAIAGGSENAAFGHACFEYVVGDGDFATGDGHRLTAMGDQAGRFLNSSANKTGGKASVYVGAQARSLNNTAFNENVFGYLAEGKGDNSVVLGNDNILNTFLKGNINISGNATTRVFSASGNIYIESDASIYMRDTSSSASNWLLANDGRVFMKNDVSHADLEGTARMYFASSGGATSLFGKIKLPDLPTSSAGLAVGEVWRSGNDLKIVT